MKTTSVHGVVTIVVEDADTEQEIAEFVMSLPDNHPGFPFGFVAGAGATAVFNNDDELKGFVEGWSDGLSVDA